jgi:mRNA interferase HigB
MRLLGTHLLDDFMKKHPEAKNALLRWQKIIEGADYKSLVDLKKTFPHADYVKEKTVFNLGGNKIRAITVIEYGIRQVIITHVLTHAEYDQAKWKD